MQNIDTLDNPSEPSAESVDAMNQYSGLVITFNEEKNIEACLTSLFLVCDDVVVVDSNSEDKTAQIAMDMGATVLRQRFLGDGPQRSFGVPHCKHQWIINLDADERVDPDLVDELTGLDLADKSVEAYECRRKNHFNGTWVKVAGQYPDYICRIFNKTKTDFSQTRIHSRIETKKLSRISGHILHFSFDNLSDMIGRMNLYSDWQSELLWEQKRNISSLVPFFHGLHTFIKFYFIKLGFIAGHNGLNISILNALGSYFKYAKIIEKDSTKVDV